MVGTLVVDGTLDWDTTLREAFPDMEAMDPAYEDVTLAQLMSHWGGTPANILELPFIWNALGSATEPLPEQRLWFAEQVLSMEPESTPGTQYAYSNAGYMIVGSALEQATGEAWEDLLRDRVFRPLQMVGCGFGAPGKPGEVDAPLGHALEGGVPTPMDPGNLYADNPAALGPAGTVHCPLVDWGRFVAAHLQGANHDESVRHGMARFAHRAGRAAHVAVLSHRVEPSRYAWHPGSGGVMNEQRQARAENIAIAGSLEAALRNGSLPATIDTTVSEALVLGLMRQGVSRFVTVLGHGSTEIGEVLRVYEAAGALRTFGVRNEVEASHAATALRWVTGERAAVVTSIGPGALQAAAGSLAAASDGLGVWYLFGDETTEDEGPNMQQIPGRGQHGFHRMLSALGESYVLHTAGALGTALRRGLNTVDAGHGAGPFFLLLPMNVQPAQLPDFNLDELPVVPPPPPAQADDEDLYDAAADALLGAGRVVVKVGAGAAGAGEELARFLDLVDGVAVLGPRMTGVLPCGHPRNMLVGGSKGSICGNYAMENADLLVAIGTRAVCQSDSSRTGYPNVKRVVSINADPGAALHYAHTVPLVGDAASTLRELNEVLIDSGAAAAEEPSQWMKDCAAAREEWEAFKQQRYDHPTLADPVWGREVMTQPAAIKVATDWARETGAVAFFDAGDVQANGFQVVEDEREGQTFTETGASYMGFAASALLATGLTDRAVYGLALSGDGSFMMNPQILIDGVQHGATGCVLLMDNRRMGAITGLQVAQYGHEHATCDSVEVDYVALAGAVKGVLALHGGFTPGELRDALDRARAHEGLSLIHLPVYFGPDPLGGLGAFGRWNVGNWSADVQKLRHDIGL